jgi:long-chain acyl-CoA synthetase
VWKSYAEIYELAKCFAHGVAKFNLCPDILVDDEILGKGIKMKFLGFLAKTRVEWMIGNFGCQFNNITIIPLYETLGINSIEYILKQTELTDIFAETNSLELIVKLKESGQIGNVKNIIYLHCDEEKPNLEETKEKLKNLGFNLISYDTIISTGKKCIEEKENLNLKKTQPDDIYLICYTSGTTDNPKGVMVPAKNICLTQSWMYNTGYHASGEDSMLHYLPLSHLMEHMIFTVNLVLGVQVGYYSGSNDRLIEDAQALRPTMFVAVPRIFERIHQSILDMASKKGAFYKKLFDKALAIKLYNYEKYGTLSHALFDPIFFNKAKNLLGGRVAYMLSASAAMDRSMMQNLRVMLGVGFAQGYGQTEGSGSAIVSSIYDTVGGNIGSVCNTLELKLVDLPEVNYLSTDVNPKTGAPEPKGEVCSRGQFIMKGYFKDMKHYRESVDDDGWLHSGDVGVILGGQGNVVKIIDRVKNLFKLSQGEYVAPDKVQKILMNSKYVNQLFLHGESLYNYAIALVYPELNECIAFLKENQKMGDIDYDRITYDDLCGNKIMEEEIAKDCNIFGRNFGLKGFEIPKKIRIINEGFTPQNNLMTPTLKFKLKEIRMKYKDVLKKLYQEKP